MPVVTCAHCQLELKINADLEDTIFCPSCLGPISAPVCKELAPGSKVAGFEIKKLVGVGGMGKVYLAMQTSMQRMVALKILTNVDKYNRTAINQFLNEVRNSGKLQHPNLITAFDAGENEGFYYLAMNYVDGEDLEHKADRGEFQTEEYYLKLSIQIADALHYAWDHFGIFHKDIKPGNIMVNQDGNAFLLDLGISQRIDEEVDENPEHVFGSPFYMSPEQSVGGKLDWRTDLYSLGATLYHLIVQVPPYDAPNVMDIVDMHTNEAFPEPRSRNSEVKVSQPTIDLMRKMMDKDPKKRFKSWREYQRAVKKTLKRIESNQKTLDNVKKNISKKPAIKKVVRPGIYVRKKSKNPYIILSYVIFLIIASGGGAYYCWKKNNASKAAAALEKADEFFRTVEKNDISELEEAVRLYQIAKKLSVGSNLETSSSGKYRFINDFFAQRRLIIKEREKAMFKARQLFQQQKYTEAYNILNKIKVIKDEDAVEREQINKFKLMLRQAMESQAKRNNSKVD